MIILSEDNKKQLLIPCGFGHALLTLTDNVELLCKGDDYYVLDADCGIIWSEPNIDIKCGNR